MHHARGGRKKAKRPRSGGVTEGEIQPIDWTALYILARSFEIQPTEFWDMTLPEFLAEMDMKQARSKGDYAGNLTRDALDYLAEDW